MKARDLRAPRVLEPDFDRLGAELADEKRRELRAVAVTARPVLDGALDESARHLRPEDDADAVAEAGVACFQCDAPIGRRVLSLGPGFALGGGRDRATSRVEPMTKGA